MKSGNKRFHLARTSDIIHPVWKENFEKSGQGQISFFLLCPSGVLSAQSETHILFICTNQLFD